MTTVGKSDRKIRLAFIAPYPKMSAAITNVAEHMNINVEYVYASLEQGIVEARKIESRIDAICSRGGTGTLIKDNVEVPVVLIPTTPFDIIKSLWSLKEPSEDIAVFTYESKMYGIQDIAQHFNISIHEFIYLNYDDIYRNVEKAKQQGISILIGGHVAADLANKMGMTGIECVAGQESIRRSLSEAIALATTRREEMKKTMRLKTMFDSLSEGVLVTDENKNITMMNLSAKRIFSVSPIIAAEGKSVNTITKGLEINVSANAKAERHSQLFKVNNSIYHMSQYPIRTSDSFVGVVSTFEDVTRIQELENQIRRKLNVRGFSAKYTFDNIITANHNMVEIKRLAAIYAKTDSPLFIQGESGTGKELFAQSIHNASLCEKGPFIAVNCSAIPDNLLESELFGYDAGAFTGAKKEGKAGMFELAHNGTIFLDEIGEMPVSLQTHLLRVIQEHELMRVGGQQIIPVNVRVISATNKNLTQLVKNKQFRDDLYYRLAVFNINVPPLRDRKEDIPLLFKAFLSRKGIPEERCEEICERLLTKLLEYNWPGNIRELQNAAERAVLLVDDLEEIDYRYIFTHANTPEIKDGCIELTVDVRHGLKAAVEDVEKTIIRKMLNRYHDDQGKVMEVLNISRSTLWRKSADD